MIVTILTVSSFSESVWSDIKREVREKNAHQTVQFALTLAERELRAYRLEHWVAHIRHVKRYA